MIHENIKGLDGFITAHPDPKPVPRVTCPRCLGKKSLVQYKRGMCGYQFVVCPECAGEGEAEVGEE